MTIENVYNKHVVLALSGGMDSTTAAYVYDTLGFKLTAVLFNYGQKHAKELEYARTTARRLQAELVEVPLADVFKVFAGRSVLTNTDKIVPDGHYEDIVMQQTVVPNRNMIMLSILTAIAIDRRASYVAYGAHSGDHAIYPDCREEFVRPMVDAITHADYQRVTLLTPFLNLTKGQVATLGNHLNVDFRTTWSCYKGGEVHCGVCGTCVERIEALEQISIGDYRTGQMLFDNLERRVDSMVRFQDPKK